MPTHCLRIPKHVSFEAYRAMNPLTCMGMSAKCLATCMSADVNVFADMCAYDMCVCHENLLLIVCFCAALPNQIHSNEISHCR